MIYAEADRKPSPSSVVMRQASKPAAGASLHIGAANDSYEREADRVAEAVVSDRQAPCSTLSRAHGHSIQRQPRSAAGPSSQPASKPDDYSAGAGKVAEAFLDTTLGKKIKDAVLNEPLVTDGEKFIDTLPGKIVAGAAAVGAVSALAASHKGLPAQIPELPLDKILPGLSATITYEGPVDHPTKAAITFDYKPKGEETKGPSATDRYRAEAARIAADQDRFRASIKNKPGSAQDLEQKADHKRSERYNREHIGTFPTMVSPPPVSGNSVLKRPADAGLRLPHFDSPLRPKPIHLLDQHLELKPLSAPGAALPAQKKDDATIQRKANGAASPRVSPDVHDVLRSSGRPLDGETRRLMESKIGADFSGVRIHTDARASASAQDMSADAYTVGNNVVFASGRYSPHSFDGRKLLAHELVHTVQQE